MVLTRLSEMVRRCVVVTCSDWLCLNIFCASHLQFDSPQRDLDIGVVNNNLLVLCDTDEGWWRGPEHP